jgi:hypothetical protein
LNFSSKITSLNVLGIDVEKSFFKIHTVADHFKIAAFYHLSVYDNAHSVAYLFDKAENVGGDDDGLALCL